MANPMVLRWWAAAVANPTPAEASMEPAVASLGIPYRFQHPIWALSYRLDFALPTLKLAIEVDDPSHTAKAKRAKDKVRTKKLAAVGWKILRCTNDEALKDPVGTLHKLLRSAGHDPQKLNPSTGH